MRKRNVVLLIVLMLVIPALLSGCFLWPKKAELALGFNPNQVPLNAPVTVIETLQELNGVGVRLNYVKEESLDQWDNIIGGYEREGPAAESIIQSFFGTTYISRKGELSCSYGFVSNSPLKRILTYGGIDDNGNTVRTSAELLAGL